MNFTGFINRNGSDKSSVIASDFIKKPKIVYLGNFVPPHSTENDIAWTLQNLGLEVIKKQENQATTDEILMLNDIDIFLYTHTHGWITPGSFPVRKLIERLKERGVKTVGYHLDYWYGLIRQRDVGRDDFWACEYMFTPDGDNRSQKWFESLGINHIYIPPAVVKRDCYLANKDHAYESEVLFVGSKTYHPEWKYRTELIDWLQNTYKDRFKLYGNDGIKSVRGHELNVLYASSKVVVGDSLCLNFDHEYYWSDRLYETRGRGGFLIHPYIKGIDSEIVSYKYQNFGELKDKIDYYLNNEKEREDLRIKNFEYVRENHTYHNRMMEVLSKLGYVDTNA